MDRIADANAEKAASADGEHGVFNVISRIGDFGALDSVEPSVDALHAMRRSSHGADGNGENDG